MVYRQKAARGKGFVAGAERVRESSIKRGIWFTDESGTAIDQMVVWFTDKKPPGV